MRGPSLVVRAALKLAPMLRPGELRFAEGPDRSDEAL
jgi:hypothetical protein